MTWLVWFARGCIFLFLFALALKNSEWVQLQLFLVPPWQVPLSAALLGAFGLGVVVGMLVVMRRRQKS